MASPTNCRKSYPFADEADTFQNDLHNKKCPTIFPFSSATNDSSVVLRHSDFFDQSDNVTSIRIICTFLERPKNQRHNFLIVLSAFLPNDNIISHTLCSYSFTFSAQFDTFKELVTQFDESKPHICLSLLDHSFSTQYRTVHPLYKNQPLCLFQTVRC